MKNFLLISYGVVAAASILLLQPYSSFFANTCLLAWLAGIIMSLWGRTLVHDKPTFMQASQNVFKQPTAENILTLAFFFGIVFGILLVSVACVLLYLELQRFGDFPQWKP